MKRTKILAGFVAVALLLVTSSAYPWGSAVHAYIGSLLKPGNANVVYGSMAPDMFNYAFDLGPLKDTMYDQLHTYPQLMWGIAHTFNEKSLAYGFMNHKEDDQTAHYNGILIGRGEGYVIAKAKLLDEYLAGKYPDTYGVLKTYAPAVSLEVSHNLVENAVDVLIRRVDPLIGLQMMRASNLRDGVLPGMLNSIWVNYMPNADPTIIPSVEAAFKSLIFQYGALFATNNEAGIIEGLSAQMAGLATSFLPPEFRSQFPYEVAFPIIKAGTIKAMELCRSTYLLEIMMTTAQARRDLAGYRLN